MAPYSLLITRQTNRVSLSIENSKMNCKYFHGSSFAPFCSTLSCQLRGDTDKMLIGTMVPSTRTTWDRWSWELGSKSLSPPNGTLCISRWTLSLSTHFHSEVVVAGCWGLCIWHSCSHICFNVDRRFFHIPVHVLQLVTWYVPITKSLPLLLGFSCLVLSGAEVKRQVSVPRVDSAKKGSGEQREGRRAFHRRETTISWEQRAKSISPNIWPINITWTKTYHFYF